MVLLILDFHAKNTAKFLLEDVMRGNSIPIAGVPLLELALDRGGLSDII